jgi:hypothetical protein
MSIFLLDLERYNGGAIHSLVRRLIFVENKISARVFIAYTCLEEEKNCFFHNQSYISISFAHPIRRHLNFFDEHTHLLGRRDITLMCV